jgi:hypothetical protein
MKPFNLERALAGDPVVTRGGRPVTQLTIFKDVDQDPLVGMLDRSIRNWKITGRYLDGYEHPYDLFMTSTKRGGWMNIYPNAANHKNIAYGGEICESKEIAMSHAGADGIACVYVEWEE